MNYSLELALSELRVYKIISTCKVVICQLFYVRLRDDLQQSSSRVTHTCFRAVRTCFNDLGLSQSGIEPQTSACEATALPLNNRDKVAHIFAPYTYEIIS